MNKDEQKQHSPQKNKDSYSTAEEETKTNPKLVYTKNITILQTSFKTLQTWYSWGPYLRKKRQNYKVD